MGFIDDLYNLRSTAVLVVGVVLFGGLVWYHSGNVFGQRGSRYRGPSSSKLKSEVADMEKAMEAILESHTGVSNAAEDAKTAVERQHDLEMRHKAALVLVVEKPTSNLHLVIRNVATRSWCKEILVVHEGQDGQDLGVEADLPKEINGKPVRYFRVPEAEHRLEFAKFYACAKWTSEIINVCFYQSIHRDTSGYVRSLWSNFLRAPEFVHSAVGAATYYNDLELTFREKSFGLNAGFAFLNGGAFFLKTKAQNYVARVDTMGSTVLLMAQEDEEDGGRGMRGTREISTSTAVTSSSRSGSIAPLPSSPTSWCPTRWPSMSPSSLSGMPSSGGRDTKRRTCLLSRSFWRTGCGPSRGSSRW